MNDILTVRDLSVHFRQGKRLVQLVDRVSFSVARRECLGILGESGSGKSMTCKALLGLLDDNFQVTGSSRFEGKPLLSQTPEQLRRLRGGKIPCPASIPCTASGSRWPRPCRSTPP